MVATPTSIYHGEESLPIRDIGARYRGRPAGAHWGQNNRSVAQPAEYFRVGAQAIGTFSGKHWAVRCRATALRSPYHRFLLGHVVDSQGSTVISCRLLTPYYFSLHLFSCFRDIGYAILLKLAVIDILV